MSFPVESHGLSREGVVNSTSTLLPPGGGVSLHLGCPELLRVTVSSIWRYNEECGSCVSPPARRRTQRCHVRWVLNDELEYYHIPLTVDVLSCRH